MDHHANGFIYHEKVFVLMQYIKRDSLGERLALGSLCDSYVEDVAFADFHAGVCDGSAIVCDSPVRDQPADARTTEVRRLWHIAGERLIKARRRCGADCNAMDGLGHGRTRTFSG